VYDEAGQTSTTTIAPLGFWPTTSDDGRRLAYSTEAFQSEAVHVYDVDTGNDRIVYFQENGGEDYNAYATVARDGASVTYWAFRRDDAGQVSGQVENRELLYGSTEIVSRGDTDLPAVDGAWFQFSVSRDASVVAFTSSSPELAPTDVDNDPADTTYANEANDVFLRVRGS